MQNEKIEDDFVRARNLAKAIRLIANSQEGDEWVHASLYWIAKAMEDNTDAITAKLPKTAKRLTSPRPRAARASPKPNRNWRWCYDARHVLR
jgi:hypothetical protein